MPTERIEQLDTPRLVLRASDVSLAKAVADYLGRNRDAHATWNPPMPEAVFTEAGQLERLAAAVKAEVEGTQIGWFLCPGDEPDRVIGHLRFSQIFRGVFHSAMLGYSIDAAHEGRGLMREGLEAALDDVFGPRAAAPGSGEHAGRQRPQPGPARAAGVPARRAVEELPIHQRRLARSRAHRANQSALAE